MTSWLSSTSTWHTLLIPARWGRWRSLLAVLLRCYERCCSCYCCLMFHAVSVRNGLPINCMPRHSSGCRPFSLKVYVCHRHYMWSAGQFVFSEGTPDICISSCSSRGSSGGGGIALRCILRCCLHGCSRLVASGWADSALERRAEWKKERDAEKRAIEAIRLPACCEPVGCSRRRRAEENILTTSRRQQQLLGCRSSQLGGWVRSTQSVPSRNLAVEVYCGLDARYRQQVLIMLLAVSACWNCIADRLTTQTLFRRKI